MQSYTTTKLYQTMAASAAPIAIGTRGTVGSLVRKEIEYFRNFDHHRIDRRRCDYDGNDNHQGGWTRQRFWFFRTNWRRKKRRTSGGGGGSGFLPSMCSAAEVSDGNLLPGFSYRVLKSDEKGAWRDLHKAKVVRKAVGQAPPVWGIDRGR